MAALTRLTLDHPKLAASILVLITALALAGVRRVETAVGYRALLGEEHAAITELDAFVRRFGGGLPIAAGWSCETTRACESVFDPAALAMAHAVARTLEAVPDVARVDSPATSPVVVRPDIGLPEARRIAADGTPAADAAALADAALRDPLWRDHIVSRDGRAGAIVVHLSSSTGAASERVFAALDTALAPFERQGFRFHLVGGPVEFVVAGRELERNTARIVPLMVALIALVLTGLLRSPTAALAALGTVGVAVVWTVGLMGWLGWPQTSLTQALTPLVLVIGVCDGIHLVTRLSARTVSAPLRDAVVGAAEDTAAPCVMTSITTAAGFASLAASPLEAIARFGALAAFATMAALALCFSLLPLLLSRIPARWLPDAAGSARWGERLARLSAAARRRRPIVLAATIVVTLASLGGIARLRVEASFEDLYGEQSRVVRWAREFAAILREPDTLEIALEPPAPPAAGTLPDLEVPERVTRALTGLDGLGDPRSILDPLRHLNQTLHPGTFLPLEGGEDGRAASLLRLLRREEPGIASLLLHEESGALRLTFPAAKLPQERLRRLLGEVRRRVHEALPPGWTATVTGPLAIVQRMIDDIRETQLRSFSAAGGIVFLAVALFFRSFAWAALAMVPTVLPVVVTLGAMGAAGIPLDVGSAMVAAVLLGLAVDDAIHLLAAARRLRADGRSREAAVDGAVRLAGRAVVVTSVALAAGFLCLLLSPWKSIARFGMVSGIAILAALFATLVLLPSLFGSRRGRESAHARGEPS